MRLAARAIIAHYPAVTATRKFRSTFDDGSAWSPPRDLRFAIPWSEPIPWRGVTDSVLVHAALLGLLYAVSIWPQAGVHLDESHSYQTLRGYQISQYLPELHGAPTHRRQGGKADPVLARQPIQSLPDAPDNLRQTIVTPRGPRLRHDVELPNLVAFQPALSAQPLQVIARSPALQLAGLQPGGPEIVQLKPRRALPSVRPDAAQPAPEAGSIRRESPLSLAQLLPPVANPALPVPLIVQSKPQRASARVPSNVAPPASAAGSIGQWRARPISRSFFRPAPIRWPAASSASSPQVLVLNAHPADVAAPVATPEGNRSGAFAASPSGHANATGAPGEGVSSGSGRNDASAKVNAPAGISVGASPSSAAAAAGSGALSPKPGAADPESAGEVDASSRDCIRSVAPARGA